MNDSAVTRELKREVLVGGFAFLILAGLFYFTIVLNREAIMGRGYPMEVAFDQVMGLRKGDSVVVRGMTIGEVKKLRLDQGRVKVQCHLREQVAFHEGYRIVVKPTSILGGRQLEVYEGLQDQPALPQGTPLIGTSPDDMLDDISQVAGDVRRSLQQGMMADLTNTVRNVREISDKINSGKGSLGRIVNDEALYNDLAAAVADVRAVTRELREGDGTLGKLLRDGALYDNLTSAVADIKEVTAKVRKNEGTLGKLVNDDKLYDDASATAANLKEITRRLTEGEGLMGKLFAKDEALYNEVKLLVQDFRATVDDFRETAPILTFTSVFFGAF